MRQKVLHLHFIIFLKPEMNFDIHVTYDSTIKWSKFRSQIVGNCLQSLTLKLPEKLQLYGLYVYYVVHICDFGMLRVNLSWMDGQKTFYLDPFVLLLRLTYGI